MCITAGYLINRTPFLLLNGKTLFELLHGKLPSYSHIRSFGCLAHVHDHKLPKDKFRARSRVCIFLEYPFNKKGWRFYDIKIVSTDVVFDETKFPYAIESIVSAPSDLSKYIILGTIIWALKLSAILHRLHTNYLGHKMYPAHMSIAQQNMSHHLNPLPWIQPNPRQGEPFFLVQLLWPTHLAQRPLSRH